MSVCVRALDGMSPEEKWHVVTKDNEDAWWRVSPDQRCLSPDKRRVLPKKEKAMLADVDEEFMLL
jgi:hypothetical protein